MHFSVIIGFAVLLIAIGFVLYQRSEKFRPVNRGEELMNTLSDMKELLLQRNRDFVEFVKHPTEKTFNVMKSDVVNIANNFGDIQLFGEYRAKYLTLLINDVFYTNEVMVNGVNKRDISPAIHKLMDNSRYTGMFWAKVTPEVETEKATRVFEKYGALHIDVMHAALSNNHEAFEDKVKELDTYTNELFIYLNNAIQKHMFYGYRWNDMRRTD